LFWLFFSCRTCPNNTRALQAAARSAADGENAFLLCKIRSFRPKAFLLNLARLRDKFVNTGCRWFESSKGSHPHRSKMQPMPKSLVLQGFFGFLGQNF